MDRINRKDEATPCSNDLASLGSNNAKPADSLHRLLASDVFRIRSLSAPSSCALSLLENVCLVLPSAIQHALGTSVDGLEPFITINPEFLEKVGVEEVYATVFSSEIDDGSSLMSSLLVSAEESPVPLWLKPVTKRHSDSDTTALSNLLLERFRQQILSSYLEHRASVNACRSESQRQGNSELEHPRFSVERYGFPENSATPSLWMPSVRSTAFSLRGLAESMEAARLAECLESLRRHLSYMKLSPESLVFTPLHSLSFACGDIIFSRLDAANAKSLKQMSSWNQSDVGSPTDEEVIPEIASSPMQRDEPGPTPHNVDDECLFSQNPVGDTITTSSDVVGALGSKKKKKKAKKRKVRLHRR
jgi:hypothetical protein